jgi:hypothetical protein
MTTGLHIDVSEFDHYHFALLEESPKKKRRKTNGNEYGDGNDDEEDDGDSDEERKIKFIVCLREVRELSLHCLHFTPIPLHLITSHHTLLYFNKLHSTPLHHTSQHAYMQYAPSPTMHLLTTLM